MEHLENSASLLLQHDKRQHVGVVTEAALTDDRIRVTAKVSQADKLSDDTWKKVQEGTLRHFSVGYRTFAAQANRSTRTITVTDWMPLEASLVAAPEDVEAALGRSQGSGMVNVEELSPPVMPETTVKAPEIDQAAITAAVEAERQRSASALETERKRVAHVFAQAAAHAINDETRDLIITRTSTIEEADEWLKVTAPRKNEDTTPAQMKDVKTRSTPSVPVIDFPDGRPGSGSRTPYNAAVATKVAHGYGTEAERGLTREITQDCVRSGMPEALMDGDVIVPWTALIPPERRRAIMEAGNGPNNAATGGVSVTEDFMGDALIEALRPMAVTLQLGPRTMPGLRDNVEIPRVATTTTAAAVTNETDALTQTEPTLGEITMTPRNIGAYSKFTDKLLMQSSLAIESLIREDLMTSVALAQDKYCFYGTGSNGQPTGIKATSGIHKASLGTGDNVSGQFDVPTFTDMINDIYSDDVMGMINAVTNPQVISRLTNLYRGAAESGILEFDAVNQNDTLAGRLRAYPVYRTNVIEKDIKKGTEGGNTLTQPTSEMFIGVWNQMVIGYWGPGVRFRRGYINDDFIRQQNTVTISTWFDVAFRHPKAFGLIQYIRQKGA